MQRVTVIIVLANTDSNAGKPLSKGCGALQTLHQNQTIKDIRVFRNRSPATSILACRQLGGFQFVWEIDSRFRVDECPACTTGVATDCMTGVTTVAGAGAVYTVCGGRTLADTYAELFSTTKKQNEQIKIRNEQNQFATLKPFLSN
eukprot:2934161-Amphidinium_carterae.1